MAQNLKYCCVSIRLLSHVVVLCHGSQLDGYWCIKSTIKTLHGHESNQRILTLIRDLFVPKHGQLAPIDDMSVPIEVPCDRLITDKCNNMEHKREQSVDFCAWARTAPIPRIGRGDYIMHNII